MTDARLVTIALLRHGNVAGIVPERFRGRAALPLTALGRRQAEAASARVRSFTRPVAVYASPLERAFETARAIAEPLGLEVEAVPALEDIDYGAWQGLTIDEARARDPDAYARWLLAPHLTHFEGGESLGQVQLRVTSFLHELVNRHAGRTIAVVAHDSVNRIVLLGALDLPLSHYRRIRQDPCCIDVLTFDGTTFAVVSMNETSHLHDID